MCDDQPILSSRLPLPVAFSRRCCFVLLHCGATPSQLRGLACHRGVHRLCRAKTVVVSGRPGRTNRQGAIQEAARAHAATGKRKEIGNTDAGNPQRRLS